MQDYNKFKVAEEEALQRENQGPSMQLSSRSAHPYFAESDYMTDMSRRNCCGFPIETWCNASLEVRKNWPSGKKDQAEPVPFSKRLLVLFVFL